MTFSKFVDLQFRMPIAIMAAIISAILIWFSHNPFIQAFLVFIFCLLGTIGLWEFHHLLEMKGVKIPWKWLSLASAGWLLGLYFSLYRTDLYYVPALLVLFFVIFFFAYYFNKIEGSIVKISCICFGFIYVIVPLGMMLKILYSNSSQDGRIWLAYLIATTKGTDVGAYFTGKLFGKMQLAPQISPKKTVTGAIGGFIFACAISLSFYYLSFYLPEGVFHFNWLKALLFGGIIGVFGQVGDLVESLFKRDAHIKDSNSLPGFGGMLDFFDSLLLTTPILYLLMKLL